MEQAWRRAAEDGSSLVARAAAAVVPTEWATPYAEEEVLGPFWREREGLSFGRVLEGKPGRSDGRHELGRDAEDRVVLVRRHHGPEDSQAVVRRVDGAVVWDHVFDPGPALLEVVRLE